MIRFLPLFLLISLFLSLLSLYKIPFNILSFFSLLTFTALSIFRERKILLLSNKTIQKCLIRPSKNFSWSHVGRCPYFCFGPQVCLLDTGMWRTIKPGPISYLRRLASSSLLQYLSAAEMTIKLRLILC